MSVAPEKIDEYILGGHGRNTQISVWNLLAYLLGRNPLSSQVTYPRDTAGEEIDFPETGFKWNGAGALAWKFHADFKDVLFERFLEDWEKTKGEIVDFVSAQSNKRLYGKAWYGKQTLGRMIQLNTSSPYVLTQERASGREKMSPEPSSSCGAPSSLPGSKSRNGNLRSLTASVSQAKKDDRE